MSDETEVVPQEAELVDELAHADDERRRLQQSGQRASTTIEFSQQLTHRQRNELSRMLECADELERLASLDSGCFPATNLAGDEALSTSAAEATAGETHHIGHYRVLRLIADGGFGAVLLAVDERDDRRVALKVPRPDILFTRRLQERFLIEGRAAATLDHPNIVSVYEILSEPVSAIAYEYCDGGTLSQAGKWIKDERTIIRTVLLLAEALQHAHTRGVLHRDLKPGNVLLVRCEESNHTQAIEIDGEWWIPKLGDFGLAKLVDDTENQTRTGVVMGTPQFMAPEQAAGRVSELGTHTDVFSLGAIFYWLLVGHPPFDSKAAVQTLKMLETVEAEPPRRFRKDISLRTEAVCLKCLRKPIDARYPSAAALAEDLRHLLSGEPVSVRPPNVFERLKDWSRRNPALAVFAFMLSLAAVLGMLLQWGNNRSLQALVERLDLVNQDLVTKTEEAEGARAQALRQQSRYAQLFYASDLQLAQRAFDAGDVKTYADALARHIPLAAAEPDLRGPEWQALWDLGHPPETLIDTFPSAIYCANLSHGEQYLVACGADASVRVYDTATWQPVTTIDSGQQEVNYAAFSADNSRIVTAGDDGTIAIWDWQTGESLQSIQAYDDLAYCAKFYDDDTKLATCGRHEIVRLWDATTGEMIGELKGDGEPNRVEQIDISDDGKWVASASYDGRRRVWRLDDQEQVLSARQVDGQRTSSVCLFRREDQTWMISGTLRQGSRADCSVVLEMIGGEDQRVLPIHFDGVQSVAVDAQGVLAAAGDGGGRISMIDINAAVRGKRWWYPETIRKSWVGHSGRVFGMVMMDAGRSVISAGEDGKLSLWHTDQLIGWTTLTHDIGPDRTWQHAVQTPQKEFFLVDTDLRVHHWDPQSDEVALVTDRQTGKPLRVQPFEESPSGSLVVSEDLLFGRHFDGPLCCWKITGVTADLLWSVKIGDTPENETPNVYAMAVSPDRSRLAVCRRGHPVHNLVLDARTGRIIEKIPVEGGVSVGSLTIAFDATGRRLAFDSGENVFVYDLESKNQTLLGEHTERVRRVCFVPGTNLLVSGADDRRICVWDLSTGKLESELSGHRAAIECLGIHPEGNRIVSADDQGWIRIWSLEEEILLAELPPPSNQTWYVSCGEHLAGVSEGRTVFLQYLRSPFR